MTPPTATLPGFVFGEHLEGPHRRSLGFRLLAPAETKPWSAEVEALARRLQAAPYPDDWPPTDLFCSVLLSEGHRLVALARYGLADHTPSHRWGGLELVGVLAPGSLGVPSALSVYQWLRRRRDEADDLRSLGGDLSLAEILAAVPPAPHPARPIPVLPVRLWQDGALLFAATAPSDPDHHLGLLDQGDSGSWQWLPLVGGDFPLGTYTQRGPLVAWTPHLSGVAVKLDRPAEGPSRPSVKRRRVLLAVLIVVLLLLQTGNLWGIWRLTREVQAIPRPEPVAVRDQPAPSHSAAAAENSAERLARSLHRLLQLQGGISESGPADVAAAYERLAKADDGLRLSSPEGKEVVVAVSQLSRRSPARVEALIRRALADKGYDPRLIDLACRQVRELLDAEGPDRP